MRFMRSPGKRLEMDEVRAYAGVEERRAHEGGPPLGPAHVDVAVGDVGHPGAQGGQVVDVPDVVAEPGVGPRRRPGRPSTWRPRSRPRTSSSRAKSGSSV